MKTVKHIALVVHDNLKKDVVKRVKKNFKPKIIFLVIAGTILLLYVTKLNYLSGAEESKHTKHIILFIGDGMHLQHEIAGSRYLYGSDFSLTFHKFPYKTYVSTWDVTTYNQYAELYGKEKYTPDRIDPLVGYSPERGGKKPYPLDKNIDDSYFSPPNFFIPPATDSASAATAIATGIKTDEGNISWLPGDPEDGYIETIAELLRKEKGYSIGVVSTVPFSHATPASFVSHNRSRENYYEIANEIVNTTKPEVVISGGHPKWNRRYMPMSLYNKVKEGIIPDYVFVERTPDSNAVELLLNGTEVAKKENKKLFGLFGGKESNFEKPIPEDIPGKPSIKVNPTDPKLKDITVSALDILSQDKDGFFLLVEQGDIDWANHKNDYSWMIGCIWDLEEAVKSAVNFVNRPGDNINWNNTLIIVTSDHGNSYMRLNDKKKLKKGDLPRQVGSCPSCSYPDGEVTYKTFHHTNELVMLYAKGSNANLFKKYEGKWYPGTQIIDNTHIYNVMREAAGIKNK